MPAGTETLVLLELAELRHAPALSGALDAALGEDDLRTLEAWLRVSLTRIDRVALCLFAEGYVVLIEGDALDAPRVVRDAGVQMGHLEIRDDHPFLRRAGRLGVERRELVALSPTRLAIGGENGAAMIALLETATGRAPAALASPDGVALRERIGPATLVFATLSAVTLPSESDVAVLLARHRMIAVGFRALDGVNPGEAGSASEPPDEEVGGRSSTARVNPGEVEVRVGIVGELPPGAEQNLRLLAESIASSSFGGLFGMREGDEALRVSASDDGATLVHRIAAEKLVTGLREVFRAELGEIGEGVRTLP